MTKTRRLIKFAKWTAVVMFGLSLAAWLIASKTVCFGYSNGYGVCFGYGVAYISCEIDNRVCFFEFYEESTWKFGFDQPALVLIPNFGISLWFLTLLAFNAWLVLCMADRLYRLSPGLCQNCGYNLTGNTSGRCPECGALKS